MTSFTRKLYAKDPAAALAFHRQDRFEKARNADVTVAVSAGLLAPITYGRHTQLVQFHASMARAKRILNGEG